MGAIIPVKLEDSLKNIPPSNQKPSPPLNMQSPSNEASPTQQKRLSSPSYYLPIYHPTKKLVTKIQIEKEGDNIDEYINQSMNFRTAKCRSCERKRVIVGRTTARVLRGEEKAYTCSQCDNDLFGGKIRNGCRKVQNICGAILTLLFCLLVVVLLLTNIGNQMVEKK